MRSLRRRLENPFWAQTHKLSPASTGPSFQCFVRLDGFMGRIISQVESHAYPLDVFDHVRVFDDIEDGKIDLVK